METRHKIALGLIVVLIAWSITWNLLPVGSGNWNAKQIQKIAAQPTSDHFCFAVMGDNKNGFDTFQKIIQDINQKKPSFAIDVGDLVFEGDKEEYRIFYHEIKKSKPPFLVAIGNHELRDEGASLYSKIFGKTSYAFSHNNSLFIVLDDANEKYLDQPQMNFLKENLQRKFAHKFVFMHVPPFDPRQYDLDILGLHKNIQFEHCLSDRKNAQEFMNLMAQYHVDAVFTSHIHGYFKEVRNSVPYFITGGAGASMWFSNPQHYFYHYINTCVAGNKVTYQVVKFPSPGHNEFTRLSYSLWLYIWFFIVIHRAFIILGIIILILTLDIIYEPIKKLVTKTKK